MTTCCDHAAPVQNWQSSFLAMLPAIEAQCRRQLARCPCSDREEAMQATITYAAVAYAQLAKRNRLALAYPAPLAAYGLKQYRAGRLVGGRLNSRDTCSKRCQRKGGYSVEPLDDWNDVLADSRRATPAEIAALRIDFGDWLKTLSPRDRRLARELARGEATGVVARLLRITAGRVSQLRRELLASWLEFIGEGTVLTN
jgi:hypothetical protein